MKILAVELRTTVFTLNVLERVLEREIEEEKGRSGFRAISILKSTIREIRNLRALLTARVHECDSGELGVMEGGSDGGSFAGKGDIQGGAESGQADESRGLDVRL